MASTSRQMVGRVGPLRCERLCDGTRIQPSQRCTDCSVGLGCHPCWDPQPLLGRQSWTRTALPRWVHQQPVVVHIGHANGTWLAHLLPGQAVDPVVGPHMLVQSESLVARTLNLGGFGLAEVALSVQVPANLKRFIGLMLLIQATQPLVNNFRDSRQFQKSSANWRQMEPNWEKPPTPRISKPRKTRGLTTLKNDKSL